LCASGKRYMSSSGSSHDCSDTPGIWTRRFFKIHTTTSPVLAKAQPGRCASVLSLDAVTHVRPMKLVNV
jgi:hypothetical protein